MSSGEDMLVIERPSEQTVLLRLPRPARRNALATDLLGAVADALDAAARDSTVRCAVITGSERVFAAGADIAELASRDVAGALVDIRPGLWSRIRAFAKPLIAAVEGWSLGAGNALVMCCDLVVAGRGANFGQPETKLGIVPGAGGTALLARLVGRTRAMRIVLLGDPLSADDAKAAGLVSEIVEDGDALNASMAFASRIAGRAPLAMRQGKTLVQAAYETTLGAHLQRERQCFAALFGTADRSEGIAALLDKRDAVWTGT